VPPVSPIVPLLALPLVPRIVPRIRPDGSPAE
jgi:hypothetical protein